MSRMFLGTELQETVEECPEYFSPNVVPPEHCWHGDETNIPVQEEGKNWRRPEEGALSHFWSRQGQPTAFLVQNTNGLSGEILSGEINVCTLYILFISYQIWKLEGLNSYQHASSWQLWHKNIVYMWTNMISTGYLPSKCTIYCSLIHLHYLIEIFFAPKDDH